MPAYFSSFLDKTSSICFYTPAQQKKFNDKHLNAGCWYLDCPPTFTPLEEVSERTIINGGVPVPPNGDHAEDEDMDQGAPAPTKEKKKRVTRATKKRASSGNVPVPRSTPSEVSGPAIHDVGGTQDSAPTLTQATQLHLQKMKNNLQPHGASTSTNTSSSVYNFIQNVSMMDLTLQGANEDEGRDPRWAALHKFIDVVSSFLVFIVSHNSCNIFLVLYKYVTLLTVITGWSRPHTPSELKILPTYGN